MWDRRRGIAGSTCNVEMGHDTGISKSWLKRDTIVTIQAAGSLGCREDMIQAAGSLVVERT
jgi:hypothetical protein